MRHDGTATGRLGGRASFMALRSQRLDRPRARPIDLTSGTVSHTDVHPYAVVTDYGAALAIGMRAPSCYRHYDTHTEAQWVLDHDTDSWAAVTITSGPPYEVRQSGQRMLWDEVVAAHRWWTDAGKPPAQAWQATVCPSGQRIELRAEDTAGTAGGFW